ncbi:MAG TPA: ribose-5-phosphate isomerase RpiA [Candidatus Acidoferrales bacterium]|nr:ribose-5-phosphate isomerase RpiA [Candidatus Acidoferrales bacterium]
MTSAQSTDDAKRLAAQKSLEFISDGMVVGLGTGSTATQFIRLLGEKVQRGLRVRGISSSKASEELAKSLSIPIIDLQQCPEIDVAIDGADEVGPGLALIKGGGGALLREKIVASAAKRFIVVADSTKVVKRLGKFPLPVEVIPMAAPLVARKLLALGLPSKIRRLKTGAEFITDEGNLILDCASAEIQDPDALAASIRQIIGVVEHGLFLHMAEMALIADGAEVVTLHK